MVMQSLWWQLFDILGTTAFALSGTMVAVSRRMDIFGVFVLAAATAVGGGILRDVIIGNIPPAALRSDLYLWIVIITIAVTCAIIRYITMRRDLMDRFKNVYLISDAIGLGSFTVTGTMLGCSYYPTMWVLAITLGVVTAVGGGVIRDVLAGQVPTIFLQDIYASASLIGSCMLYIAFIILEIPAEISCIIGFSVTLILRMLAIHFHWNLPRVRRKRRDDIL